MTSCYCGIFCEPCAPEGLPVPFAANVSIGSVSSNEDEALDSWRSIVRLWVQLCTPKAGLQSLEHWTSSITRSCAGKSQPLYGARIYVTEAEPRNERELARALSIGFAVKGF